MKLFTYYTDSYKGLRKEVWFLALITLINKAGTMVIPFLSLYLTEGLDFSLKNVGWIMTIFGVGSMVGSWLGGKLTDRIGYYPTMFWSLFSSGIFFIFIQFATNFWSISVLVFLAILCADAFRPGAYVAIATYSKPENKTRSISLMRLAINLGFSAGPAAGGFLIVNFGYGGLFWVDGITCILAGLTFILTLSRKEAKKNLEESVKDSNLKSPYTDGYYLLTLFSVFLIGFAFLQYFSTIPLYYNDVHKLNEAEIGYLMALNGLLIFAIEMPIIKYFDNDKFSKFSILIVSTLMFGLSFFVLNILSWIGVLTIGVLLMTAAEILNFPFLNTFAMERAEGKKAGDYMALFTMAFSASHIFGHNSGMQLIERFGYENTWYVMTGVCVIAALILVYVKTKLKD